MLQLKKVISTEKRTYGTHIWLTGSRVKYTPVRAEKFCTPDSERREVTFLSSSQSEEGNTSFALCSFFPAEREGSFLCHGERVQRTSNEDKHFSMFYNEFEYIDMDDYFRLLFFSYSPFLFFQRPQVDVYLSSIKLHSCP